MIVEYLTYLPSARFAVSDEGDLVTAHLVISVGTDNRRVYRYPFFKRVTRLNLTTALTVLSFLTKC